MTHSPRSTDRFWTPEEAKNQLLYVGGVAFIGPFGSGKTALANLMTTRFNAGTVSTDASADRPPRAHKLSHADALRYEVMFAILQTTGDAGICQSDHHGDESAGGFCVLCVIWIRNQLNNIETKAKWRSLLQAWGATKRNEINEDYWLNQFLDGINARVIPANNARTWAFHWVFNDDTRYPNEYTALRRRKFMFIRVEGPDYELSDTAGNVISIASRVATPQHGLHESEQHWPQFEHDAVIPYENGNLASRADIAHEAITKHFGLDNMATESWKD